MRFLPYLIKNLLRSRGRTLLTLGGVGVSLFLFVFVQSMQAGLDEVLTVRRGTNRLIVYHKNRF
ncbi:MAG: hypothetical protein HYY93_01015 [Planctomycetes bacterium]|nr:hypothetical protein [Planctomycetota bacterium]